jgi:hypothetical protein
VFQPFGPIRNSSRHDAGSRKSPLVWSRFDLMNAVTATARNLTDPEARWRLEELGGAIPFEAEKTPATERQRVLTA